jgi:hypothetical protein
VPYMRIILSTPRGPVPRRSHSQLQGGLLQPTKRLSVSTCFAFQILAGPPSPAVEPISYQCFHAINKRVLVDRPDASMKLLVYEIAKSFDVVSWRYILGPRQNSESVVLHNCGDDDDNLFFVASFANDSSFDEQVYSKWHGGFRVFDFWFIAFHTTD